MEKIPVWVTRNDDRFLVGCAHGEVWLWWLKREERCQLGEIADDHGNGCKVLVCLDRYVLVGVKRGVRVSLEVFDVEKDEGVEKNVELQGNSKFRGLADAKVVGKDQVLVACGRGIGVGHIWLFKFGEDGKLATKYLGRVTPRTNTIEAMRFGGEGCDKFVTVANDRTTQCWDLGPILREEKFPFTLGSKKVFRDLEFTMEQLMEAFDGDEKTAQSLFDEVQLPNLEVHTWIGLLGRKQPEWVKLFPPRLLNPLAYDGEMDDRQRPHGFGTQVYPEEPHLLYEGEWYEGMRHGRGQVTDERTGTVLYIGGFKHGERHGFGVEHKGNRNGESYQGWWRHGHRHGLGIMREPRTESYLEQSDSLKKAVQYVGFFRDGVKHGLGWVIFPKGCPRTPYRESLDSVSHLGAICCIMEHVEGEFCGESNYHRLDRLPIPSEDRELFNFHKSLFGKHADGHYDGDRCWMCLSDEEKSAWVVCGNPHCCMRVHADCIHRYQITDFKLLRKIYCEDDDEDIDPSILKSHDKLEPWFCPMRQCQQYAAGGNGVDDGDAGSESSSVVELEPKPKLKLKSKRPKQSREPKPKKDDDDDDPDYIEDTNINNSQETTTAEKKTKREVIEILASPKKPKEHHHHKSNNKVNKKSRTKVITSSYEDSDDDENFVQEEPLLVDSHDDDDEDEVDDDSLEERELDDSLPVEDEASEMSDDERVQKSHLVQEVPVSNDCQRPDTLPKVNYQIKLFYLNHHGERLYIENDQDLVDALEYTSLRKQGKLLLYQSDDMEA